jgi:hypothetical protein
LNLEKCTFGVPQEKLLEYIITEHGIKVNPDKISTIAGMGPVKNVKDIQGLMGCLVALSRFMSRLGECRLPLYKLLKKSNYFHWTEEVQTVLDELKVLITKPSVLAPLEPSETLQLYITTIAQVVSARGGARWRPTWAPTPLGLQKT